MTSSNSAHETNHVEQSLRQQVSNAEPQRQHILFLREYNDDTILANKVFTSNMPFASFTTSDTTTMPMTTATRIAVSGYKNTRKSHVGIHLWEAPPATTTRTNSKKRKQIMIVHIDDHSIFASSVATSNEPKESSPSSSINPSAFSAPATLKVGMKLISVNGVTIRPHHSIQEIYAMLQNAIGCVTLLVCTPTISAITANQKNNDIFYDKIASSVEWGQQHQQQRHDDDSIPEMESLIINDAYGSASSASSSFSSSSSLQSSSSSSSMYQRQNLNTSYNDDDDDDDDDDESIINDVYALESKIRSIWSPILTSGNNNRQRHR